MILVLHDLYLNPRDPLYIPKEAAFIRCAERICVAIGSHAPGTTDAMDLALGLVRQIIIYYVGYVIDVDTPCGDIGSDKHPQAA
jgi:hypothetical protein